MWYAIDKPRTQSVTFYLTHVIISVTSYPLFTGNFRFILDNFLKICINFKDYMLEPFQTVVSTWSKLLADSSSIFSAPVAIKCIPGSRIAHWSSKLCKFWVHKQYAPIFTWAKRERKESMHINLRVGILRAKCKNMGKSAVYKNPC
jgi:hypothetical protein